MDDQQMTVSPLDPEEETLTQTQKGRISIPMTTILLIALGAAVGANARYVVSLWAAQHFGTAFPYGTLIINVVGSGLIGVVLGLAALHPSISGPWRLLLVTGLLGGFTTFSTFSYEGYALLAQGQWQTAGVYVLGSVGLGLVGTTLGVGLARLVS